MSINVITEDRASGAQVIDGSLKFDASSYLTRTPSSAGNRNTWTWSGWVKRSDVATSGSSLFAAYDSSTLRDVLRFDRSASGAELNLQSSQGGSTYGIYSNAKLRDTGWYHVVAIYDDTNSTTADKQQLYVNGERLTSVSTENNGQDGGSTTINNTDIHYIGARSSSGTPSLYFDGAMSQVYFVDGQALGPENFGFTDPLTNTWRPKKYKVALAETVTVQPTYVSNSAVLDPTNAFDGSSATEATYSGVNSWLSFTVSDASNLTVPFRIRNDSSGTGQTVAMFTDSGGSSAAGGTWGSTGNNNLSPAVSTTVDDTYTFPSTGTYYLRHTVGSDSNIFVYRIGGPVTTGGNSFYLPMDGNSPIGKDQSGNNNDWTPVNFGGSNSIEKATGALPILNTVNGGNVATAGVRTDSNYSNLVLALPLVGNANDVSNQINSGSTTKTVTANGSIAASSAQSNFYGRSYYFDGSDDHLNITAQSDVAFGTGDFTLECWVYFSSKDGSLDCIMETRSSTSASDGFLFGRFQTSGHEDKIELYTASDYRVTADVTTPDDTWVHVAVVRQSGTTRVYVNGTASSSTYIDSNNYSNDDLIIGENVDNNYQLDGYIQDFRIYKGVAKYTSNFIPASTNPDILPDTPSGVAYGSELTKITDGAVSFDGTGDYLQFDGSAGSNPIDFGTGDFTVEAFVYHQGGTDDTIISDASGWTFTYGAGGNLRFYMANGDNIADANTNFLSNQWVHVAAVRNSGTLVFYQNGTAVGSHSYSHDISANGSATQIGKYHSGTVQNWEGFISNLRVVQGTALYTSAFTPPTAPLTNVTNTKLLTCQSTTSATAAAVTPGSITANGNAVSTNFNPFTTDINAVRGQESGYCTLNPLSYQTSGTYGTSVPILSDGNLTFTHGQTGQWERSNASFGVGEGKWYFEFKIITRPELVGTSTENWAVGVRESDSSLFYQCTDGFEDSGDHVYWIDAGTAKIVSDQDRSSGSTSGITAVVNGDTINIAFEKTATALKVWFGKNGIYFNSGSPETNSNPAVNHSTTTGFIIPSIAFYQYSGQNEPKGSVNFGQKPFKFSPPNGFQPLTTADARPETVISNPEIYFKPLIYDAAGGQGGSRHIDVGFEADFIWIKNRNNVKWHILVNGVIGYNKFISSNSNMALSTEAHVTNVHKTGYTVNDIDSGTVNEPGLTYVAWNWKAGGHSSNYNIDGAGYATASAAGLSCTADLQGASIGTKQGFSIIQYQATSGETVAHGLSQQPDFMMIKNYDTQNDWMIYHKNGNGSGGDMSSSQGLNLNNADGTFTSGSNTFITGKSATTFTVGSSAIVQNGSDDYCAFVWHDVPGLQKFGYYVGNNSSDGVYVELGFKPALLIIKRTDADGYYWTLFDSVRRTFNVNNHTLNPESNRAEETSGGNGEVDFLSSGFKCRDTDGGINGSGGDYIYMAWAEAPAFNLYGAQSNAR